MDQFSESVGFIKRSCVFFQPMGYVKVHVVAIELDEDFLSWHLFQLSTSQVLQGVDDSPTVIRVRNTIQLTRVVD